MVPTHAIAATASDLACGHARARAQRSRSVKIFLESTKHPANFLGLVEIRKRIRGKAYLHIHTTVGRNACGSDECDRSNGIRAWLRRHRACLPCSRLV